MVHELSYRGSSYKVCLVLLWSKLTYLNLYINAKWKKEYTTYCLENVKDKMTTR